MNNEQLKGKAEQHKGRIQETIGALNHDTATQLKGMAHIFKGKLTQTYGDVKEFIQHEKYHDEQKRTGG